MGHSQQRGLPPGRSTTQEFELARTLSAIHSSLNQEGTPRTHYEATCCEPCIFRGMGTSRAYSHHQHEGEQAAEQKAAGFMCSLSCRASTDTAQAQNFGEALCVHCGETDTQFHRGWCCPNGEALRTELFGHDLVQRAVANQDLPLFCPGHHCASGHARAAGGEICFVAGCPFHGAH